MSATHSTSPRSAPILEVCAALLLSGSGAAQETGQEVGPMLALYHNEDCTELFFTQPPIPEGQAGPVIDRYVDQIADSGVTVLLCNTNARRTNYRSQVWEAFWEGYDPTGPDTQPFLASLPPNDVQAYRRGIGNMLAVHQQGVDYPAHVLQRCRHHGISAWITLRMNDCHYNDNMDHPFHGTFWRQYPEYWRQGCTGYYARCLDYARQEVRDYYQALIAETLNRYDIDGLELDFMREPYLFSSGQEAAGAALLTAWIRDVRRRVTECAARRGHAIRLGIRVPSHPAAALGLGLDAPTWAREGLIDVLVVTPRWATLEFDLPISQWRELLGASKVTLAGGLEILYRPCPGGPAAAVSPELATGAAVSVLSRGADAVYLFNYFHPAGAWRDTRRAMTSFAALQRLPRTVGVTYRDITGPGEAYQAPLPATGSLSGSDRWTPGAAAASSSARLSRPRMRPERHRRFR